MLVEAAKYDCVPAAALCAALVSGRDLLMRLGRDDSHIKEARELAFKSSPVASVANWRSPVLFVHGDDDRNVPFQQTTDLVEKLRGQNVEFEELIFPDEIHDLLRWSDWIRAYRATAEFFDRRLAGSDKEK